MEIVNPVPADEVAPWLAALATTLLHAPWTDDHRARVDYRRRHWDADRTWGARDRGRWVATLATQARSVTVPGPLGSTDDGATVDVGADALTGVTVAATHRRRGLLRQMIAQSLDRAVARGDALAVLIAAEWPIYGRFGYAPASYHASYTFHRRRAGSGIAADPAGSVRQVTEAELGDVAASVFDAARRRHAGQVSRADDWWAWQLGLDGGAPPEDMRATWLAHESDAGIDGLLGWRVERDFKLDGRYGRVAVTDLATASDLAYRNLWAYLGALDVVEDVTLTRRPVDEPARWLLADGRTLTQGYTGDGLWLRILDVPAALSARGYATPGSLVLEIVDPEPGGYARGRYRLDADEAGATCVRTDASADLVLPQRLLAAAYLGGNSLRQLAFPGALAGGMDELTPGASARLDTMLSTPRPPWNPTMF